MMSAPEWLKLTCRAFWVALLVSSSLCLARVEAQTPRRWIVGVDRSASREPQQMADMRQFLQQLGEMLSYGDRVVLVQMFTSDQGLIREVRDSTLPLRNTAPTAQEARRLDAVRRSLKMRFAVSYTDTVGQKLITSTDILGFLRRASAYARSGTRMPTTIVLLSDMLHSTRDLNMEMNGGVKGAAWVERQRTMGLIPDLQGVCIAAVGAGDSRPRDRSVRAFWTAYFKAAGARFDDRNYRPFMAPSDVDCA